MSLPSIDGYAPKHLSHSSVDSYRMCGMKFKLSKVLQKEQRPGLAGIGGNAVHDTTEAYDYVVLNARIAEENPDLQQAESAIEVFNTFDPKEQFKFNWDRRVKENLERSPSFKIEDFTATGRAAAEYGGKRNVQWWLDNGPVMVQRWIDWRQNGWEIWETPEGRPAIELELSIVLPGDTPVKGFIDRIMVTPAGQLVVVDIKTGRAPETPEQLGLYAVGIEQLYGEMFRPDWGYFWDAAKGQHGSPQALGMYTAEYFAEVYDQAARGISAGVFLAKPANSCSNWCGVSRYCKAVGGSEA